MQNRQAAVEAFFEAYGRRSDAALQDPPVEDVEGLTASFAPFFVAASPHGVVGGANDNSFQTAIPEGFAHYRQVGGRSMRVTRIKVTVLDGFNVMTRVDWNFAYVRPRDGLKGNITFQNIYFLNFATGEPKIFAYITPDEQQAMRDHGLV